ncbi:UNVERIFIED_ORG: rRNA-processing protein FCF1 [Lelliottia amnigena]|nr:rRNA-processing protein FCF1 [Lelliottia amnigena]
MKETYALDTNAYALLFKYPKTESALILEKRISEGDVMSFLIPEIVSMEIYSVLGKYKRGSNKGSSERCSRKIYNENELMSCSHTCFVEQRPKLKNKVFKALLKLLSDIENQRGAIKATSISLNSEAINKGRYILREYAHKYAFGSHDALVAASVAVEAKKGRPLVLVTSDKSLKAVCQAEKIPFFDPLVK